MVGVVAPQEMDGSDSVREGCASQPDRVRAPAPWGARRKGGDDAGACRHSSRVHGAVAGLFLRRRSVKTRAPPLLRKGGWGRLRPQAFKPGRVFARGAVAPRFASAKPPPQFFGGASQRFGFGCAQGFARSEPEPKRGGQRRCVPMRLRRAASRSEAPQAPGFPLWENLIGFGATRWRSGRTV